MSTTELKEIKYNLVNWIGDLSDAELIGFLNGIRIATSKKDLWNELSDVQKKQILVGMEDADNAKLLSSEEFWDKLTDKSL